MDAQISGQFDRTTFPPPKETLRQLAVEIYERRDGDVEGTIDELLERVRKDKDLLRRVLQEIVLEATRGIASSVMRQERAAIIRNATKSRPLNIKGAVAGLKEFHTKILLDFMLGGSVRLRAATREQVLDQAAVYRKLESTHGRRAKWLESIAAIVPKGKLVGEVLTETTAHRLLKEAGL